MMKKTNSMPETIPRGPFTSLGLLHKAKIFFLPWLPFIQNQEKTKGIVVRIEVLLSQKFQELNGKATFPVYSHSVSFQDGGICRRRQQ